MDDAAIHEMLTRLPNKPHNLKPANLQGRRVRIFGLQNAQQYNNASGTVISSVGHGGRWAVLLDSNESLEVCAKRKELAVRAENLEFQDPAPTLALFIVGMGTWKGKDVLTEVIRARDQALREHNVFLSVVGLLSEKGGCHPMRRHEAEMERFMTPSSASPFGGASDEMLRNALAWDLTAMAQDPDLPYMSTKETLMAAVQFESNPANALTARIAVCSQFCSAPGCYVTYVVATDDEDFSVKFVAGVVLARRARRTLCAVVPTNEAEFMIANVSLLLRAEDMHQKLGDWLKSVDASVSPAQLVRHAIHFALPFVKLPALVPTTGLVATLPHTLCFSCQKLMDPPPNVCSACDAVAYCSRECQFENWQKQHGTICNLWRKFMARDAPMRAIRFPTTANAGCKAHWSTVLLGNDHRTLCELLSHADLHNGIFLRLCKCACGCSDPYCGAMDQRKFGELAPEATRAALNLPMHDNVDLKAVALARANNPPRKGEANRSADVLQSWEEYYLARGINGSSPAALVLTYPLTLYYVLTECKQLVNPVDDKGPVKKVLVHLIGPEIELDVLDLFHELAVLLPNAQVTIVMVGPSTTLEGRSRLTFTSTGNNARGFVAIEFFNGTYQAFASSPNYRVPHLCVAFNADFDAVDTKNSPTMHDLNLVEWAPTLWVAVKHKIPFVVSEYSERACDNLNQKLQLIKVWPTVEIQVNPFRQPLAFPPNGMTPPFPWFSNGFLFGFN